MGDLDSGLLTLLTFALLALFGIVAFFSLRKHMRGIQAPYEAELEAAEADDSTGLDQAGSEPGEDLTDEGENGKRSPKASSRS